MYLVRLLVWYEHVMQLVARARSEQWMNVVVVDHRVTALYTSQSISSGVSVTEPHVYLWPSCYTDC